jgi:pyruvate dehydrogenase E2 component (dihydrolipoamide acetyltransferase)
MTQSGAEVVPATIVDNADIDHWPEQSNVTAQIIMAIVAACAKEPNLNAWFDAHSIGRRVLEQIDIAIAVDTSEGLFTPVIRDAAGCDYQSLTSQLQELRASIKQRRIAAQQMRDYTITVSNFGMIAGRYATPIVVPPTVAIIGAGRIEVQAVIVGDEVVAHRLLPLSLTFDHRAVTGGEAARFMAAMIESLETVPPSKPAVTDKISP